MTPLVLALGGFPISAELPGLGDLVCLRSVAARTEVIPSFGRRSIGSGDAGSAYDEEMVERLWSDGADAASPS